MRTLEEYKQMNLPPYVMNGISLYFLGLSHLKSKNYHQFDLDIEDIRSTLNVAEQNGLISPSLATDIRNDLEIV